MSRIKDALRGRDPAEPLPLDLGELSGREKRKAVVHRREHMQQLAAEATTASRARRAEILSELKRSGRDLTRLREVGVSEDYAPGEEGAAEAALRAKWERSPTLEPRKYTPAEKAVSALIQNWIPPRELHGLKLSAERISDEEGKELTDLLDRRYGAAAGTGWKAEHEARFEEFVEKLAGWECFTAVRLEAEKREILEEARRSGLPKRVEFAEIGSVTLPAEILDALLDKDSSLTLADVAALYALLGTFELRDASLLRDARFEGDALLVKGRKLRFVGAVNPSADPLGPNRIQPDIAYLARAGWFDVTQRKGSGGRTEIRLGPKGKALREGRVAA